MLFFFFPGEKSRFFSVSPSGHAFPPRYHLEPNLSLPQGASPSTHPFRRTAVKTPVAFPVGRLCCRCRCLFQLHPAASDVSTAEGNCCRGEQCVWALGFPHRWASIVAPPRSPSPNQPGLGELAVPPAARALLLASCDFKVPSVHKAKEGGERVSSSLREQTYKNFVLTLPASLTGLEGFRHRLCGLPAAWQAESSVCSPAIWGPVGSTHYGSPP